MYLLDLKNVNYEKEAVHTNQSDEDKSHILMQILELNETIDEIKEAKQVDELEKQLEIIIHPLEKEFEAAFNKKDFKQAVDVVSKMKYYRNVDERLKDLKLKFKLIG